MTKKEEIKFQQLLDENLDNEIDSFSEDIEASSMTGCQGVPCTQNAGCPKSD